MGISAYNRGSRLIRQCTDAQQRPVEFEIMSRLNGLPKTSNAVAPFLPIQFVNDHHGWWAECPITGFGYCYPSLAKAVQAWKVTITTYDQGIYIGEPDPSLEEKGHV